jgi:hypothetical protein
MRSPSPRRMAAICAKGTAGVGAERILRIALMNVAIWRTALLQGPSLGTTGPRFRAVIPHPARK